MDPIFDLINKEIRNGICVDCSSLDSCLNSYEKRIKFLSYWNYGNKFDEQKTRIAFVGKTTWMDPDTFEDVNHIGNVWDIRSEIRNPEVAYNKDCSTNRAFWRYVKNISCEINGQLTNNLEFLDYIYVTNLAKCWINVKTDYKNRTPLEYFENCFQLFKREMELVNPTHVIYLTGTYYDEILGTWDSIQDSTSEDFRIELTSQNSGKRYAYPWWSRKHDVSGNLIHTLRTRHPQGAITELKEEIIKWFFNTHPNSV